MGKWCLNEAARKRLAEKYCLYMHGVGALQRALEAGGYKQVKILERQLLVTRTL